MSTVRQRLVTKTTMMLAAIGLAASPMAGAQPRGYDAARWDPIHFKPAIETARDAQCLVCHQEILERRVRAETPAGLSTAKTLAWYQTLGTYRGEQETFHRRHLVTDYAKQVMDLRCNTCHRGNDPREETAGSTADADPTLIQRKHVDPKVCLLCHGRHNAAVMGVPPGDWRETGAPFQFNCLICHAAIRSNRHQVNYLKPEAIEAAAARDPDVCFGCHGGRAWYLMVYPYPRHPWPGSGDAVPDWAKDRPSASEARFLRP